MHCMVKLLNFVFTTKLLQCISNFFSVIGLSFSSIFLLSKHSIPTKRSRVSIVSGVSSRISTVSSVCSHIGIVRSVSSRIVSILSV